MFTKKNTAFTETSSKPEGKSPEPLFVRSAERAVPPEPMGAAKFAAGPVAPSTQPKEPPVNQKPTMPNPPPAFRPDLSRLDTQRPAMEPARASDNSRFDVGRKPEAAPAKSETASEMRKLIVGRDIALTGEISACDYLVVEGTVEARVREGRHIEIAETGLFRGTVEIDEADIAGRFEGDIMVRGRLKIRGTGRIDGKIQYGELEVENGGHLEGEIHSLKGKSPSVDKTDSQVKARTIPVADVAEPAKV